MTSLLYDKYCADLIVFYAIGEIIFYLFVIEVKVVRIPFILYIT